MQLDMNCMPLECFGAILSDLTCNQ